MACQSSALEYHLATLDGEGPWCDWVRELQRHPVVFGYRKGAKAHGQLNLRAFIALRAYIRREQINVIYVCGIRAAFILRWMKPLMPGVCLVQGVRWNPASDSRLDHWFRFLERWSNLLVDGYITNSQIAADTLAQRCRIPTRRIHVIYNGLAEIPADDSETSARPLEVLTVANLSPRKDHLNYLNAITLVLATIPQARFIFVGRDDMSGEVQHAIEQKGLAHAVRCVGFQMDVSSYLKRARLFVLPSPSGEGCPTALLESFAWGCPVVAYAADGIPELVNDNVDGFVVPPRDVTAMAEKIITMLNDGSLAVKFGQAGKKKVADKFTLGACAKFHEIAIKRIVHGIDSDFQMRNVDTKTVGGFGLEWAAFDQSGLIEIEKKQIFNDYFSIFPWGNLPSNAVGADIGCGSGRWASIVAPRVGFLHLIDASEQALEVARKNLGNIANCTFGHASVAELPFEDGSLDFAYSLGVLHHVPDTAAAIASIAVKMKRGAPLLLYLYYAFDNRSWWYRAVWKLSDLTRKIVSTMPFGAKSILCEIIAALVYWPMARCAKQLAAMGKMPMGWPLAYYRDKSFYVMRTDALDRFGTRLEQRFSKGQIECMLREAGMIDVRFSDREPYWCAVGVKK